MNKSIELNKSIKDAEGGICAGCHKFIRAGPMDLGCLRCKMCTNYVCEECSKIKEIECVETNGEWPKIKPDKCIWEFYYSCL